MENKILSGMTRAEALGCITPYEGTAYHGSAVFIHNGKAYPFTTDIGLRDFCTQCSVSSWQRAINAYYDDQEKPKWVEPVMVYTSLVERMASNATYDGYRAEAERTNARRKIEAFIRANGGGGIWCFIVEDKIITSTQSEPFWVGTIGCATRELAEAVIERFPDELKLLCEVSQ